MKALTTEILKGLTHGKILIHRTDNNADGTPVRARVAGKPKVWKTRPNDVVVSMKYGLKDWFKLGVSEHGQHIDQSPEDWALPEGGEEYSKRT